MGVNQTWAEGLRTWKREVKAFFQPAAAARGKVMAPENHLVIHFHASNWMKELVKCLKGLLIRLMSNLQLKPLLSLLLNEQKN